MDKTNNRRNIELSQTSPFFTLADLDFSPSQPINNYITDYEMTINRLNKSLKESTKSKEHLEDTVNLLKKKSDVELIRREAMNSQEVYLGVYLVIQSDADAEGTILKAFWVKINDNAEMVAKVAAGYAEGFGASSDCAILVFYLPLGLGPSLVESY